MSFGSYMGVALALGLVLVLLGVSLKLLQRLAPGTTRGRVRIPMEIVQRMSIGPKQGIAVVRVGSRIVAVTVGEGGMRRLFELDDDEVAAVMAASEPVERSAGIARPDFKAAFTSALKTAGIGGSLVVVLLAAAVSRGNAQVPAAPVPAGQVPAATVPVATAPKTGASAASAIVDIANLATQPPRTNAPRSLTSVAPVQTRLRPQTPTPAPQVAATAASKTPQQATPAATAPAPAAPAAGVATLAVTKLAPSMDLRVGDDGARGGLRLSGTVGIVVMMGLLTLLPTLLLMMTSFTRILIVLHFLRQALGTQNAPPAQLVAALALLLSGFVMAPTLTAVNRDALQPWMAGTIDQGQMLERGAVPFRAFMLRQTRDHDLQVFVDLSQGPRPATAADVPLVTLMSAFVTSELRTAFQIGFALFLPFIIIDVVVSSVLMSMGMFMLPPAMISLPFKLLLFVLVDGWTLIVQSLVASFR
ncbi:MAG: flagellar type III secretion system pore protein FliP [bacterium]